MRKREQPINGSFLKLFKTLTARVLSNLKIIGLRPRIFKLDNTLLFVRVLNIMQIIRMQCVYSIGKLYIFFEFIQRTNFAHFYS